MQPNPRASSLAGSATLALDARAKELIRSGMDVINMACGEPDFDAPAAVQAAAVAAVGGGNVRYTPPAGRPDLRETVARHLSATRSIEVAPEEVVITHSGKHALSHAFLALLEEGDEVLMPLPAWSSYDEEIRFAGGVPLHVGPRADMGPNLDAIEEACTDRTKGILLNTPCNPSGYVWRAEELRRLGDLALERDLWILSDEIYGRLVFGDAVHVSPATLSPELRARTLIVDGASKAYAMTGYRIGFLFGPANLIAVVARMQSQLSGSPNAISQEAFLAALSEEPPEVEQMVRAFDERRQVMVEGLRDLGLDTPLPRGAFYAFPSVLPYLDERGAQGFCADLLEEQALAIVPGEVFGMDDHVRLSCALSVENIRRALERLGAFLDARQPVSST
jgi:aspartate aminotransferase